MAKAKNYEGFGEVHGLREWARLLDVNKDTLRYWLVSKEVTVEEFARVNKIKYKAGTVDSGRINENRVVQAEALLRDLFERSGYNPDKIETDRQPGANELEVRYMGRWVGLYYLYHQRQGVLAFKDGRGINLLDYPVNNPMIFRDTSGDWDIHPDTKMELFLGQRKAEGFGVLKSVKEWAEALDLPPSTIQVNLDLGATIEKIAKDRGIQYP